MKAILIEGTSNTPTVILDPKNNIFKIEGFSLLDNAKDFYSPIIEWMNIYSQKSNAEMLFEMKMRFFNTASSKALLDFLFALETVSKNGTAVKINWYYKAVDVDMKEAGEDYEFMIDIPFSYIAVK